MQDSFKPKPEPVFNTTSNSVFVTARDAEGAAFRARKRTGAGPLSRSLERQLLAQCGLRGGYWIAALAMLDGGAPDTLDALLDATRDRGRNSTFEGGPWRAPLGGEYLGTVVPVYAGHSTGTIWTCRKVNWLFRAWHDAQHIILGAEFDARGEEMVARHSVRSIEGSAERAILWAETIGQVWYHEEHGAFPSRQRDFVRDAIVRGLDQTIRSGLYHRESDRRESETERS